MLLFGLGLALLLAEAAVRIFGHEGPIYTFRDPLVGRRYTRSWEGDVFVEESGQIVHLAFNAEGMRDRDWPEAPGAAQRVAVLGDSMVAGVAASRPFPSLALGAPPAPAEVMNWGVAGSSPSLELRLYEQRVRRYRPTLVVVAWFEGNDLSDDWQPLGGRRQAWMEERPDGALVHLPLAQASSPVSEWLARHSRFYVWQNRLLARLRRDGDDGGLRAGLRAFSAGGDAEVDRAWRFQERVLGRFAASVRADGARFAVLHLPTPEAVYDDAWQSVVERAGAGALDREAPRQRLEALCARLGVPFASAAPVLRERARQAPEARLFFARRGHLDDEGHALVAGVLERLSLTAQAGPAR